MLDRPGAALRPDAVLRLQRTVGNRATGELLRGLSPSRKAVQRVSNAHRDLLNTALNATYAAGQLTGPVDFTTLSAQNQASLTEYLTAANLQYATVATGFWHQNAHGMLPAYSWISPQVSAYVEYNMANSTYNRAIYDAITGEVYLSPHYAGFVRLSNPPATGVARLEGLAATNIGYILAGYDADLDGRLATAQGKVGALRVKVRE